MGSFCRLLRHASAQQDVSAESIAELIDEIRQEVESR